MENRIMMIRRNRGFTLTEMMIVISVIGLMVAIGTPPVIQFLRHYQAKDAAQTVLGVLRQARSRAIQEKNNFVVSFDTANNSMTILDDDGGGNGNPAAGGFVATNRGNGRLDSGERVYGPYELPGGQVFGLVAGSVDEDGEYITKPVTFSGLPPTVTFYPNGSTNEEGIVMVMPYVEFREQKRGTSQMMIVRRSTGSVVLSSARYN